MDVRGARSRGVLPSSAVKDPHPAGIALTKFQIRPMLLLSETVGVFFACCD